MSDKVQHLRIEPKLRFPEFNISYKDGMLGDFVKYSLIKTDLEAGNLYVSTENIEKDFGGIFPVKLGETSRVTKVEKENILMSNIRPYLRKVEIASFSGGCSSDVLCFDTKNNDSTYFKYMMQRDNFIDYVMNTSKGTKMPRGDKKSILNYSVSIPSNVEQKKLADSITTIENKIKLTESKIENLKLFKKGLSNKFFAQSLRFKNKSDGNFSNWEHVKIGDIYAERSSRSTVDQILLSVTMNDGVKMRSELDAKDNSSKDKSNYKLVKKNDLVYNSMRMWQGANGISKYDGIVSPAYTVMYSKKEIDHTFMGYLFKYPKLVNEFRKNSQGLTRDTWNLKYPLIKNIKIYIPSLIEQQKIAQSLQVVDEKINVLENNLVILKQFKKGLLQKMFV
jgi:type I restriction enzyme S subunit